MVQPCLHPLAIPTASLFATTGRTPTRLSAERTRRSGRGNLPFLLLVRAAAIATTWDARAQPASTTGTRGAQVVTVRQYGACSREERTSFPGKNTLTFIASSLRAQLVIDSHFRVDPLRYPAVRQSHSIEKPKVDRVISRITARDGLRSYFYTTLR